MIPFAKHTITLYNRLVVQENGLKKTVWKRTVLKNVFWSASSSRVQDYDRTERKTFLITVKIPPSKSFVPPCEWTGNGWTIQPDDIIVLGSISDEVENISEIKSKYRNNAVTVRTAENLTEFPNPHYKAICE